MVLLLLDEPLQAIERPVPLDRDLVQVAARDVQVPGVERPDALPPPPDAMNKAGTRKDAQVLRDGLARDSGARSKSRDGERAAGAQPFHKGKACRITQGRKDRHDAGQLGRT